MRTIVDIPEDKIKELDELGKKENQPKAVLIREAIGEYLHKRKKDGSEVFGLWKNKKIDSLKAIKKASTEDALELAVDAALNRCGVELMQVKKSRGTRGRAIPAKLKKTILMRANQ